MQHKKELFKLIIWLVLLIISAYFVYSAECVAETVESEESDEECYVPQDTKFFCEEKETCETINFPHTCYTCCNELYDPTQWTSEMFNMEFIYKTEPIYLADRICKNAGGETYTPQTADSIEENNIIILMTPSEEEGKAEIIVTEFASENECTFSTAPGLSAANYCFAEGQYSLAIVSTRQMPDDEEPTEEYSTADAFFVNWDNDEVSCNCLSEVEGKITSWNENGAEGEAGAPGGKCCGDDLDLDTGFITTSDSGQFLCAKTDRGDWDWIHVSEDQAAGDIYYAADGNYDILSGGNVWYSCDSNENGARITDNLKKSGEIISVASHEYVCYTSEEGTEHFAECAGSESSYNSNYNTFGKLFSTGQSVEVNGIRFYCSSNKKWYDDLDKTDKTTCENFGFNWTGTLCCGDDTDDTYNEVEGSKSSGCYLSEKISSLSTADSSKLINSLGLFYSCNLTSSQRVQYTDNYHNTELIPQAKNKQYCSLMGNYFCSPEGYWNNQLQGSASIAEKTNLKSVPVQLISKLSAISGFSRSSCCQSSYCWNGTMCTASEAGTTKPVRAIPYQSGKYVCINGEWNFAQMQCEWNVNTQYVSEQYQIDAYCGTCPSPTQCMVEVTGNALNNNDPSKYINRDNVNNPQCIESGQFIGDHYCENAAWTSRTKLVAAELLKIADNNGADDYTLFCDNYKKVLNNVDYNDIEKYFKGTRFNSLEGATCTNIPFPCVNNICVLTYNPGFSERTVMGISLNKPINDAENSFLKALDKAENYCNSPIASNNQYKLCKGDDFTLWYSQGNSTLLFSKSEFTPNPSALDSFLTIVKNPILSLIDIFGVLSSERDLSFIKGAKDFNRIYISNIDGKSVQSIVETTTTTQNEFVAANYTGFSSDVCKSFDNYASSVNGIIGFSKCDKYLDSYYIVSDMQGILNAWPDLTSKIRIG